MSRRSKVCFEATVDGERRRITLDQRPTDAIPLEEYMTPEGETSGRITVEEPDARSYDDELPRLPIPGTGEAQTRDADGLGCGEIAPIAFCDDCGEPTEMRSTCGRSRCPECWQSWAFHATVNNPNNKENKRGLAPKIEQYRRNNHTRDNYFQHITVSFAGLDVRFNSKNPLKQAFKTVYALLREVGVDTGRVIFHAWRIKQEHRGDVRGHESGDGDLTWKDVQSNGGLVDQYGWEHVRDEYLVFEPHFHVLTYGHVDVSQTEAIERETGVVVHRIEDEGDSNVSVYGLKELCAVGAYSYSHAGLEPRNDGESYRVAARWFGDIRRVTPCQDALDKADEAMREVAHDVLGVSFAKPECREEFVVEPLSEHGDACGCGVCDDEPVTDPRIGEPTPDLGPTPTASASTSVPTSSPEPATSGRSSRSGPNPGELAPADRDLSRPQSIAADGGAPIDEGELGTWDREIETGETPLETRKCGGSLVPMYRADEYLECDDWVETIADGTLERLEEAKDEWEDLSKPKAENPTEPVDGPNTDAEPPGG